MRDRALAAAFGGLVVSPKEPSSDAAVETVAVELPVRWTDGFPTTTTLTLERPFRPWALLLWGCGPETVIDTLAFDGSNELLGAMPGGAFEATVSYEEFARSCQPRPCDYPLVDAENIGAWMSLDLPTLAVGAVTSLGATGPLRHAVLIGSMVRSSERP